MTVLTWDTPGEHVFQTGVDRGVLYVDDDAGVAWNGLTGVDDNPSKELKSYYLNGVKYLEYLVPDDYAGTLKAITYPDEFDAVNGSSEIAPGLFYHNQPSKSFGLSYRTLLGDDKVGVARGYIIHIIYNVLANPDSSSFDSISDNTTPIEFSWSLTSTPIVTTGYRPLTHISIDSTKVSSEDLSALEDILYGTSGDDPRLPTIAEVTAIFAP